MVVNQYDIIWGNFDPSQGHETKRTRPCVILSPNEMNHNIATVIVAPITSKSKAYPTRVALKVKGKAAWMVLDQIRTIDQKRLTLKIAHLSDSKIKAVKAVLTAMLLD